MTLLNTLKRQYSNPTVLISNAGRNLGSNLHRTYIYRPAAYTGSACTVQWSNVDLLFHFPGQYFSVSQRKERTPPWKPSWDTWDNSRHLSCSSFCDIRSVSLSIYISVKFLIIVLNTCILGPVSSWVWVFLNSLLPLWALKSFFFYSFLSFSVTILARFRRVEAMLLISVPFKLFAITLCCWFLQQINIVMRIC